ncbi:MAG: endonuclease III [Clostridiales bacterium]|nr:endonuclease III [Clostridiales bacterium]
MRRDSTADAVNIQFGSREHARLVVGVLEGLYPEAICSLEYSGEPWKLLIMGRLSAQCTDARVNIVCRELFSRFPTLGDVADAPLSELEEIIRPCGLYRTKSAQVKEACRMLRDEYGGVLPRTMEECLRFPGVGRKVANLLLGDIYGIPGIVADTHCIRICGRLGFYPEDLKDPARVEKILSGIVEPEKQSDFCHRLVLFGRDVCRARDPQCATCALSEAGLCPRARRE